MNSVIIQHELEEQRLENPSYAVVEADGIDDVTTILYRYANRIEDGDVGLWEIQDTIGKVVEEVLDVANAYNRRLEAMDDFPTEEHI